MAAPPEPADMRGACPGTEGRSACRSAGTPTLSAGDSLLEEAARRVAEQLPPLTDEQRARIAALLAPALAGVGDDA